MIKGFGQNSDMGYVHCAFIAPPVIPSPKKQTNKQKKDYFLNFQAI